MISTGTVTRISSMRARTVASRPSRMGRASPSHTRVAAARMILGSSPSEKTTRRGEDRALWYTMLMTSRPRTSLLASSSRYWVRSTARWATPLAMAASATAGATHRGTRGSTGFGMR